MPQNIQQQLDRMQREIDDLKKSKDITRDLSFEQQDAIREIVTDKIAQNIWEDFFYYYSIINNQVGTPGNTIGDTDIDTIFSNTENQTNLETEARFRASIYIANGNLTTGFTGYVLTLDTTDGNTYQPESGCGFKFTDAGEILAVSINEGNETTAKTGFFLQYLEPTPSRKPFYILECRFFPRERVDFFINNKYITSISTNIPARGTYNPSIFSGRVKNEVTQFSMYEVEFVEFLQRRKKV